MQWWGMSAPLRTGECSVLTAAFAIRLAFMIYGMYQDARAGLPFTDIDYGVFTDAARYTGTYTGSHYKIDHFIFCFPVSQQVKTHVFFVLQVRHTW